MTQKKRTFNVEVNLDVLNWVINSSGWKKEELIKKLDIASDVFEGWVQGGIKPTLRQLQRLAWIVKRPLAVFLLSKPLAEKPVPKDYRMMPDKVGIFDKKTIFSIRRARRLQSISKELSENLGTNTKVQIKEFSLSDDPRKVAEFYRNEFQFNEDFRKKAKTPYDLFYAIRDLIEDRNILVFQISMPLNDARGFALADESPYVLVVNSADQIEARIFTLLHEFGHALLKESGISIPEYVLAIDGDKTEKWCNEFASAFLLPVDLARTEFDNYKQQLTETKILEKLSRKLKVSKAMLLYNMRKLSYIGIQQYSSVLNRYHLDNVNIVEKKIGKIIRAKADKQCLSEKGQKFVSLITNNIEKGFITHSDALGYLSIKSKNLDKVMSKAKR